LKTKIDLIDKALELPFKRKTEKEEAYIDEEKPV